MTTLITPVIVGVLRQVASNSRSLDLSAKTYHPTHETQLKRHCNTRKKSPRDKTQNFVITTSHYQNLSENYTVKSFVSLFDFTSIRMGQILAHPTSETNHQVLIASNSNKKTYCLRGNPMMEESSQTNPQDTPFTSEDVGRQSEL